MAALRADLAQIVETLTMHLSLAEAYPIIKDSQPFLDGERTFAVWFHSDSYIQRALVLKNYSLVEEILANMMEDLASRSPLVNQAIRTSQFQNPSFIWLGPAVHRDILVGTCFLSCRGTLTQTHSYGMFNLCHSDSMAPLPRLVMPLTQQMCAACDDRQAKYVR